MSQNRQVFLSILYYPHSDLLFELALLNFPFIILNNNSKLRSFLLIQNFPLPTAQSFHLNKDNFSRFSQLFNFIILIIFSFPLHDFYFLGLNLPEINFM